MGTLCFCKEKKNGTINVFTTFDIFRDVLFEILTDCNRQCHCDKDKYINLQQKPTLCYKHAGESNNAVFMQLKTVGAVISLTVVSVGDQVLLCVGIE